MTPVGLAPSIFDSYNARALAPAQVAKTFVPSQIFKELANRAHTLIVGPRGSGKTTLLKMLQQPALEAWNHAEADEYRAKIDYTGVFIPADISWSEQVKSLGHGKLRQQDCALLGKAAFTTHVLGALVDAMITRIDPCQSAAYEHRRVSLSDVAEAEMVAELSIAWYLSPQLPRLISLRSALQTRLSEIAIAASQEEILGLAGRDQRLGDAKHLHLHFQYASSVAVAAFNEAVGERGGRWALLFDEMELAPDWMRTWLIRSLRSFDQHFLFKLALSPYSPDMSELESALAALPGHDYTAIPLWYAHKERGFPFCRALLDSMLRAKGLGTRDPGRLLGRSEFESSLKDWSETGTAYYSGSRHGRRFKRMMTKDKTFRNYLSMHEITSRNIGGLRGDKRAALVRKVAPLVAVRLTFRTSDKAKANARRQRNLRSRKNPQLYAGAQSLFAISEGNPRWFIGILHRLLATSGVDIQKIEPADQSREIQKATQRFRALLRTIPSVASDEDKPARGVLSLIDAIGEYFFERVVLDDFNPDPPGSFTVDARASADLLDTLDCALNSGAIVFVPETDDQVLLSSFRGKRFRISYLLAPEYGIPIRLGRAVSLGRIVDKGRVRSVASESQPLLWESADE